MPDLTTDRPTCIGCDREKPIPDQLIGGHCWRRIVDVLEEIAAGYDQLDPRPTRGGGTGRGAPGFGSRSPARDEVLVLTDARGSVPQAAPGEAVALLRVVGWWADEARGASLLPPRHAAAWPGVPWRLPDLVPPRTVRGECEALAEIVDVLGAQWWVGEMMRSLDNAVHHLRKALDALEPTIPLGRCPRPEPGAAALYADLVAEMGEIAAARSDKLPRCEGEVRAKAWGHTASCRRCRHRWEGEATLRQLGEQLGEVMLDLPGLSRYLGVESLATLRSWAYRDGWRRERTGGRTLYLLADAQASWWAAWDRRFPMHGPAVPPLLGPEVPPGWVRGEDGWAVAA